MTKGMPYCSLFGLLSLGLIACAHPASGPSPEVWHLNVSELPLLLQNSDLDHDQKISVHDQAPPFLLHEANGSTHEVVGTYAQSVLMQELKLAQDRGAGSLNFAPSLLHENPLDRTSRLIGSLFWDGLTKRLDEAGLEAALVDPKNHDAAYLYVPQGDEYAFRYYRGLAQSHPNVRLKRLPRKITPAFFHSLEGQHGLLSLQVNAGKNGQPEPVPYVVPGGRFNEMYGWDSYFIARGLLLDGKVALAKALADNQAYQIRWYGKILNANRTYYLTRSQPPFFTSLVNAVYEKLPHDAENKSWRREKFLRAVREYREVWTATPHLEKNYGLSRFYDEGEGPGPEVEPTAYDAMLIPFAKAMGISPREYLNRYQKGEIQSAVVERLFKNDRTVRETGHDTTYRFDMRAADFLTVDLNSLLYRYEKDIAAWLREDCGGRLNGAGTSEEWEALAKTRQDRINALLWDEKTGFYFDFDMASKQRSSFVSATGLYPLWAGLASPEQAKRMLKILQASLEEKGGVAGSSELSRGPIQPQTRPQRQWDFPNGWAPHQVLVWEGLLRYGFREDAHRLIHHWLGMIARNARDYGGTVTEKYDVEKASHQVFAEYGNQGSNFSYITKEGFGWTNASYRIGYELLSRAQREELRDELRPSGH